MKVLRDYAEQVRGELVGNVLPFYMGAALDGECGGWYGFVNNELNVRREAPKGLVQHGRMVWSFAHAYRRLGDGAYLEQARRAYAYLLDKFWDREHGGMFWLVDAQGRPLDKHKIVYGQAFAIYGLSEYFLATGEQASLDLAVSLFRMLEQHAVDKEYGGYFDAFEEDWCFTDLINVDETAVPTVKSMNTHLHMLEAYTNLLRAWNAPELRERVRALIGIMLQQIIDRQSGQMKLHFDAAWESLSDVVSFGHDIEASWLLVEAAEVFGDVGLLQEVQQVALHMAQVAFKEGLESDGSLREGDESEEKIWWVQVEGMVGFLNAYQMTGEQHFLAASLGCWHYVQQNLIDHQFGEWIFGLDGNGRPLAREKSGLWKAPYHNGRACLEIVGRVGREENK